jgi:hypothetical protein
MHTFMFSGNMYVVGYYKRSGQWCILFTFGTVYAAVKMVNCLNGGEFQEPPV